MPKVLVCQHVPYEILGTLDPLFRNYGLRIRYVNFGRDPGARPRLRGYHGLVVLGGPMGVDEVDAHPHLATELDLIQDAIRREIPVLGVCLGAQLIAKALGAEVRRSGVPEIGWYDVTPTEAGAQDPLFSSFNGTEMIFQWHADTFDLPEGAVHLASSQGCPSQAFRYRDNVYALQFHLEVDAPMIERWLTVPVHQRELESLRGKIDPEQIRRETQQHIAGLMQLSDRTFERFIGLFGNLRRRPDHPHR